MTIPIQPVTINPQVIGAPPAQDPGSVFLQYMIQGAQLGQNAQQFRQRMKLEQDQLALHQQQLQRQQREDDLKLQNTKATGEALRTIILGDSMSSPTALAAGVQAPPGPYQALAGPVAGAAPENIPGMVEQARSVLLDQDKARQHAEELAGIEQAIGSVQDPAKQAGARAVLTFAKSGANLPREMQQALWPELFPADNSIDPQAMNAATTLFRTGVFSWGQARRQAGLQQVPGVPDDVKYVAPSFAGRATGRTTELQAKAANFLTLMQGSAPLIDQLIDKTGGVTFITELRKGTRGEGFVARSIDAVLNKVSDPDQQQLLSAMRQFSQGWRFAISGQQSSDKEAVDLMNVATEEFGDAPALKAQKRTMRQLMIQGIADLAQGYKTPVQVLDQAMRIGGWSPRQLEYLQQQRRDALTYEQAQKAGKGPLGASGAPAVSPDDLQTQLDEIKGWMQHMVPAP